MSRVPLAVAWAGRRPPSLAIHAVCLACGSLSPLAVFWPAHPCCRRVVIQDASGGTVLYHAMRGQLMPLPEWSGELRAAGWDGGDPRLLAAVNEAGGVSRVRSGLPGG